MYAIKEKNEHLCSICSVDSQLNLSSVVNMKYAILISSVDSKLNLYIIMNGNYFCATCYLHSSINTFIQDSKCNFHHLLSSVEYSAVHISKCTIPIIIYYQLEWHSDLIDYRNLTI